MTKPLIYGAALGGIVVFVWSLVSWTMLPWHNADLLRFQNEDEVAAVLANNMTRDGLYALPAQPANYNQMTAEEKKACEADMMAKMSRGPVVYGLVRGGYTANMGKMIGVALFFDILCALLVSMLLMKTTGMTYSGRLSFIVTAALAVGLIAFVPSWIWFGYPSRWLLTMIADTMLAWFFAGLIMAKVAAPPAAMVEIGRASLGKESRSGVGRAH